MVSLAGMATPADSNVKYNGRRKRGHKFLLLYIMKKVRAGIPFCEKNTSKQRFSEGK